MPRATNTRERYATSFRPIGPVSAELSGQWRTKRTAPAASPPALNNQEGRRRYVAIGWNGPSYTAAPPWAMVALQTRARDSDAGTAAGLPERDASSRVDRARRAHADAISYHPVRGLLPAVTAPCAISILLGDNRVNSVTIRQAAPRLPRREYSTQRAECQWLTDNSLTGQSSPGILLCVAGGAHDAIVHCLWRPWS